MNAKDSVLRFGAARLDVGQRLLLIDGQPARLGARAFDVLLALVERRDRVVSKSELFDIVWPGVVVEENNLQVHISTLRKLLGPHAISTIPGRGYRFTVAEDRASGAPPAVAALASCVAATSAAHTNLPAHQPPLYGRDFDLQTVGELLRARPQVSIVGASGVGKSRLALAVAAAQRERFPDGVWWINLAPLNSARLVAGAIAQGLGVRVGDERPALETVTACLRTQSALLVLDNCEHLLDAAAESVSALMMNAPGVRVLVTSQEPLHVPDEQVYRLGCLAVDKDDASASSGAVELFVARAQAADPRLRLDAVTLVSIAAICRQLDGIPLAIELAAARVRLLGIDGVHARLDKRFHVLTGGTRAVLRRHQTLRAALDWSHGLLSPEEQTVFSRLGVFVGGFTMELAQAVTADERIDRWAVLDLLGHLVDKSLIIADGDDVPRYRLLETMRAFALEKLAESGGTPALMRRHAEALLAFLQPLTANRHQLTPAARVRIGAELDNLRTALAWATSAAGDRTLGCALAAAGLEVWWIHELRFEGIERTLSLLPLPEGLSRHIEADFNRTLAALGSLSAREVCFRAAQRAVELYRSQRSAELVDALCWSAMIACWRGETADASAAIAEAETLVGADTPPRQQAALAVAKALAFTYQGRHEDALACELRQAEIYRNDGNEWGEQIALSNAALYECGLGRFDSAIARLHGVLNIYRRMKAPYGAGHSLVLLAAAHGLRGDRDEALTFGREALQHSQRIGLTTWMLLCIALAHSRHSEQSRAVCLAGYFDATYARIGRIASPMEAKAREEIRASAAAALSSMDVDRYTALGSNMTEERAVALALDTDRDVHALMFGVVQPAY